MAITFVKEDKVILITAPQTVVTIQELVDAIRNQEDELDYLDIPFICEATGKQNLGGGQQVGITLQLLDDWRVQFQARPGPAWVSCRVTGGNLVAFNEWDNNPIKPSNYVQVVITSSSSATIAELEIVNLKYMIENLRDSHAGYGDLWYWDPYSGDDLRLGDSPDQAVKTFAKAQSLAAANNRDVIICLAKDPSGPTVTVEQININKDALLVRGPGRDFIFNPVIDGIPTVTIQADSVELCGFRINSAALEHQYSLMLSDCNNVLIHELDMEQSGNDAIFIINAEEITLKNINIEGPNGDGIEVGDNVNKLTIEDVSICEATGWGINLTGTGIDDTRLLGYDTIIHDCTAGGIYIGAGAASTMVGLRLTVAEPMITIVDEGVGTYYGRFPEPVFGGYVHVDTVNGIEGTLYPRGTESFPVKNMADALTIAERTSIRGFKFNNPIVLDQNYENYSFVGTGAISTNTVIISGVLVNNCYFERAYLTGYGFGFLTALQCVAYNLGGLSMIFDDGGFQGTITAPVSGGQILVKDSMFTCSLDLSGTNHTVTLGKTGDITLLNLQDTSVVSLQFNAGHVTVDDSCTGGILSSIGDVEITDSSSDVTIINRSIPVRLAEQHGDGSWEGSSPSDVWHYPERTITSGGTSPSDVWNYPTRTITAGGTSPSDIWNYEERALTTSALSDGYLATKVDTDRIYDAVKELGGIEDENAFHIQLYETGTLNPLIGAKGIIRNTATGVAIQISQTKEIGRLNYTVNSGTYNLYLQLWGYQFDNPIVLTVSNLSCSPSVIYGTKFNPSAVYPDCCTVYGNLTDFKLAPHRDVRVTIFASTLPKYVRDVILTNRSYTVLTSAGGNFEFYAIRGAIVRITIDDAGVDREVTIPNQESAKLVDLLS